MMETERLILRKFQEDDWKDLHEYLSQKKVLEYEPYDVCSEDRCKELVVRNAEGNSFFAVCLKETGKMIGQVYFNQTEPSEFLTWEIGYVFNPDYCNNGYATEACRRIIGYGFKELNAYRVLAMCNPDNIRSWKLMERLNMRREAHLVKNAFFWKTEEGNPIWFDSYQYAVLKKEWDTI